MKRISRERPPQGARSRILSSRSSLTAASSVVYRNRGNGTVVEVAKEGKVFRDLVGDQPVIDMLKAARMPLQHFRDGKYIHVSDIIHKCARRIALVKRLGLKHTPKSLPDGHAITFAQGDAIGDFVRKRFIEAHPDKVWGNWSCRCGASITPLMTFVRIPDIKCAKCGYKPNRYVEVRLTDDDLEVVGSIDLILFLEEIPAYHVVEIKSINKDQWDTLERPIPDHRIQGLFYWRLMRQKGYSLTDSVSVLYVKKEFTWMLPYKEFLVHSESSLDKLEPFDRDLKLIKSAKDHKAELPARIMCGTPSAPEAKNCSVCVTCFQLAPEKRRAV